MSAVHSSPRPTALPQTGRRTKARSVRRRPVPSGWQAATALQQLAQPLICRIRASRLLSPEALFQSERFDNVNGAEMKWEFPVVGATDVLINLFFAETFTSLPEFDGDGTPAGDRIFDISVEGVVPPIFDDIDQYSIAGTFNKGFMLSYTTAISDGVLDLEFLHGVAENTVVKAIEIIALAGEEPEPLDYDNYAQILTADQIDPDSVAGDDSVGDDDDATISVSPSAAGQNSVSIAAGADGSEPDIDGGFVVSLEEVAATDTVVSYTVSGSATPDGDYSAFSGEVTILAGQLSAPIDVSVLDDLEIEGDESVSVTLDGITSGDANVTHRCL